MEFFKPEDFRGWLSCDGISAAANRLLKERGTVVYGHNEKDLWWDDRKFLKSHSGYRALLINIEPIEKDTAESLLREQIDKIHPVFCDIDWLDRVKKVLEGK